MRNSNDAHPELRGGGLIVRVAVAPPQTSPVRHVNERNHSQIRLFDPDDDARVQRKCLMLRPSFRVQQRLWLLARVTLIVLALIQKEVTRSFAIGELTQPTAAQPRLTLDVRSR